jgi:Cdc6-like AAA superfamily ATPase
MKNIIDIENKIKERNLNNDLAKRYERFGLGFNPFPKSGIADLQANEKLVEELKPLDEQTERIIDDFVIDSLFPQKPQSKDKYISLLVRGDYGTGKTQILLYIKRQLELLRMSKEFYRNPFVIYIDSPGVRLSELIGKIIEQIGDENFKKFLWDKALNQLKNNNEFKSELGKIAPVAALFSEQSILKLVNYREFFDNLYTLIGKTPLQRKNQILNNIKKYFIQIFSLEFGHSTIANYFYELISENIGVNKTWETLTSGGSKDLDKKEVPLLNAVVKLVENQGYTDFFILVDEFEAVSNVERIGASEREKYLSNLRALIDKERRWCAVFAMTGKAFADLRKVMPPLADRLSSRFVDLYPLNIQSSKKIIKIYLESAKIINNKTSVFEEDAIDKLVELTNGILRVFLKACFNLLERMADDSSVKVIDIAFINKYFQVIEQ